MKLFRRAKDGGPESTVTGYWLVEAKRLFSVVLLRFENGSRDAFHSHAFNGVSWVLRGKLREELLFGEEREYRPSWWPIFTGRNTFHRVVSEGTSWVLNFRGPWRDDWMEYIPGRGLYQRLTKGRTVTEQHFDPTEFGVK